MKLSITILITACVVAFVCFISCKKESLNPVTRVYDVNGFKKVMAGDDHEIIITKGTTFSVQAKGDVADLNDLRLVVNEGTLKIDYPSYSSYRKRVHVIITMPELVAIDFSGSAYGNISGFKQQGNFSINLSGAVKFIVTASATLIDVDVSGTSKLTLNGTAATVVADISGQAKYYGYAVIGTDNAIVKAAGQGDIHVSVDKVFTADASGESRIYYKGEPTTKNTTQSGFARIVKE